jgi:uncharacterized phage infection (PIP) family protein YhgE
MAGRTSRYTNPEAIIEIPFDPVLYLKIITDRRVDISFDNYFEKARLYQNMLESGQVKNLDELARMEKVSKARISQIMALRNLAPEIKDWLLTIADSEQVDLSLTRVNEIRTQVNRKKITEKKLRQIAIIRNHKQQIQRFREFLKSYTAIIEPNQD